MSNTKLNSKAQKSLTTQEYMPAQKQKHLTQEQRHKLETIFKLFNGTWPKEEILLELEENGFDDTAVVNKRMDNQDTWKEVKKVTKSEYIAQKKKKHPASDGSARGGKKGGKGRKSDRKPKSDEDGVKSATPTDDKTPQTSDQKPEEVATQNKTDTNGSASAEQNAEHSGHTVGTRKEYTSRQKNFNKPAREQPAKPKQPSLADILRKKKEEEEQQIAQQQEQSHERKPRTSTAQRAAPAEKRGKSKKVVEITPSESQESAQHAPSFAEIVAKGPQQPVQSATTAPVVTKAETTKQGKQQPQTSVPAAQSLRPVEPVEEQQQQQQQEEQYENDASMDGGQPLEETEEDQEEQYEEQHQQTQEENVILPNSTFGVNGLELQFGSFGVSENQQQQQQYQNQQQTQHTNQAPSTTQQQHEPEQQPSAPSLSQQPQEGYYTQNWSEQEQQQYPHQYPQQPEQFTQQQQQQQANIFQYQQQHQFEKPQEPKQAEQPENAKAQQLKYQTPYTPVMAGNQYPQGYPYYMMSQFPYYQYPKNYPPPAFHHYPKNPYATYPQFGPNTAANTNPNIAQYPGYVPHTGYDDNAANMEYSKLMQPNYYGMPQQTQQMQGADKQRPAQKTDKRAQGQDEGMQDSKFPYETRHLQQQQYMPYGNYNAAAFMHQQYPQHHYMMNQQQQAAQLERMRPPQKQQSAEQQWGGQYNQQ